MKIGFEYINLRHFTKLVGVEHIRIDVGSLFLEIGIFRKIDENLKFSKMIFSIFFWKF